MRKIHGDLMNEVSSKANCISNKYNVQIGPLYFKCDKFIPTLERQFPAIFNEVLNPDHY